MTILNDIISMEQSKEVANLAEEYKSILQKFNHSNKASFNAWL
jgi:hypothetical protein